MDPAIVGDGETDAVVFAVDFLSAVLVADDFLVSFFAFDEAPAADFFTPSWGFPLPSAGAFLPAFFNLSVAIFSLLEKIPL